MKSKIQSTLTMRKTDVAYNEYGQISSIKYLINDLYTEYTPYYTVSNVTNGEYILTVYINRFDNTIEFSCEKNIADIRDDLPALLINRASYHLLKAIYEKISKLQILLNEDRLEYEVMSL